MILRFLLGCAVFHCFARALLYLTTPEIDDRLQHYGESLHSMHLDGISYLSESIGRSVRGKPIKAYCFGNCQPSSPSLVVFGGIHGREGLSVMATVEFVSYLLRKLQVKDESVTQLLRSRSLWIIPSTNPDPYDGNIRSKREIVNPRTNRSIITFGLKRKNERHSCDATQMRGRYEEDGIDLNRNFPVCFDIDEKGSSARICSEDYRGPSPLSEPETQSLHSFFESKRASVTMALSLHSYGRSILHPYSCQSLGMQLNATYLSLFQFAVSDLLRDIRAKYTTGQAWSTPGLYSVNGDAVDYLFSHFAIPSFSVELPPSYPQLTEMRGFWPAMEPLLEECNQLLLNALRTSGCNLQLERRFLKNRGFGECRRLRVSAGDRRYALGVLRAYESMDIQTKRGETVVVDVEEERFVFAWSEKEGRFKRRVESTPTTETVVPLSVECREEEVTEVPFVMKMYPSGRMDVPWWIKQVTSFRFAVSSACERGIMYRCLCIIVLLSVRCAYLHSRVCSKQVL